MIPKMEALETYQQRSIYKWRNWRSTICHDRQDKERYIYGYISPVTVFTAKDLRDHLRIDVLFAQPLPQPRKNVDFIQQFLHIPGFVDVQTKVGEQERNWAQISKTRLTSSFKVPLRTIESGCSERVCSNDQWRPVENCKWNRNDRSEVEKRLSKIF